MKPLFLIKNTQTAEQSFFSTYAEVGHTYDKFHYHHEYELHYNIQNNGTRFVGDSIEPFSSNELVLLGPNIPHYWKSDLSYYKRGSQKLVKVVVIQFIKDFAGKDFFSLPEMKATATLLDRSKYGVYFYGSKIRKIGYRLRKLTQENNREKLLSLISVLCDLAEITDYRLLASQGFCELFYKNHNEEKISKLYNYLITNFHRELNLSEVADHINLNPSAFCRYLKNVTNKTFSDIINELRIGIACKNLIYSNECISQIAYDCGYNNVSYFNRQFKKLKNMAPREFRLKYRV